MYGHQQKRALEDLQELRREGGRYLREMRLARGLSQRQFASLIGAEYYTLVSQIETGRGRVPPAQYHVWANALDLDPCVFVRDLLRFYNPMTYKILFDTQAELRAANVP